MWSVYGVFYCKITIFDEENIRALSLKLYACGMFPDFLSARCNRYCMKTCTLRTAL